MAIVFSNLSRGSNPGSPVESKTYLLPLGEPSWVRIAKITDVSKNSSGLFTLNCYGVKENLKEMLTTSIFSVGCGLDDEGKIIADVLPITQTPEISASSASGGNGSGGGSASGSGEGGTKTGMFGLTSVTIEEYDGEMYVCGLVNFPATETYTSLEVEMLIEHNLNYSYLEELELVDFTNTNGEYIQALDGAELKKGATYIVSISTSLEKYINAISAENNVGVTILSNQGQSFYLSYNRERIWINDVLFDCYDYPNDLINISKISFNGNDLKYASSTYNILDTIQNSFKKNNAYTSYLKKISGRIEFEQSYISDGEYIEVYLNGEHVATLGEGYQGSFQFCNLNEKTDFLSYDYFGGNEANFLRYNIVCDIDLENTECVIESSFWQSSNAVIESYTIDNNELYDFQLKLIESIPHNKSNSYDLFSVYNRLDDIESDTSSLQSRISRLEYSALDESKIIPLYEVGLVNDEKQYGSSKFDIAKIVTLALYELLINNGLWDKYYNNNKRSNNKLYLYVTCRYCGNIYFSELFLFESLSLYTNGPRQMLFDCKAQLKYDYTIKTAYNISIGYPLSYEELSDSQFNISSSSINPSDYAKKEQTHYLTIYKYPGYGVTIGDDMQKMIYYCFYNYWLDYPSIGFSDKRLCGMSVFDDSQNKVDEKMYIMHCVNWTTNGFYQCELQDFFNGQLYTVLIPANIWPNGVQYINEDISAIQYTEKTTSKFISIDQYNSLLARVEALENK